MLSRVAESIYWIGRYIERAENVARFVDVNLHLMLDLPASEDRQWEPLVTTTGDSEYFRSVYGEPTQDNVTRFLTFDSDYPSSIFSSVRAARENARSVREVISSEMWEQVNAFYLFLRDAGAERRAHDSPYEFFQKIKTHSHLFTGLTDVTMSHGEAWHFLRMGRLIERADKTSRILDVKYFLLLPRLEDVGTPYDSLQWAAVLKSASAFEMYRKRHHRIQPQLVAKFLIFDREFPRALRYCLIKAENSLYSITGSVRGTYGNEAERRMGRLRSELDYSDIEEVRGFGMHEYLDRFQAGLNAVGSAIFETFFAQRFETAPVTGN